MKKNCGFTIIELIVFIVVALIIATNILLPATNALRYSYFPQRTIVATQTAAQCSEWLIGQRDIAGYASIACGAYTSNFCSNASAPTGYFITANVNCSVANNKSITILVTGYGGANLSLNFANY